MNPEVKYLNLAMDSRLISKYKNPPGVMNIAKEIPVLSHKFVFSQAGHGMNHKNDHPNVMNTIQKIKLPERLMSAFFILKRCFIGV